MKENESRTKLILKGISAFFIYFFITEFKSLPFILLNIDVKKIPQIVQSLYIIVIELIVILLIFLLFKDYIIKCFKDLKKNHKKYFKTYFKYWFLILILTMLSNGLIVLFFPDSKPANQVAILELMKSMPVYTFIVAVIIAPFIEEFAFRLSFRAIFKNKYLFILLSGILFGSAHVIGLYQSWVDLLYIIPYSIPGCIFAYTLYKSDNIFVPIGLHFVHNGIVTSLQLLLILLGVSI